MTQEEKQLLIKDLCARLPYGVIVKQGSYEGELSSFDNYTISFNSSCAMPIPYLRPMSSMTEEEVKEFATLESIDVLGGDIKITCVELTIDAIDWLNKKMFDYRGLIHMGLALEAPEGMYEAE